MKQTIAKKDHIRTLGEHEFETSDCVPESAATSEVLVAGNDRLLGSLKFDDTVRPEAAAAVAVLRDMGLRTVLLTRDVTAIAPKTGRQREVDAGYAELLPEQKVEKVQEILAAGRKVAMVGNGINDAPALSQANVGVTMRSGTEAVWRARQRVPMTTRSVERISVLCSSQTCVHLTGNDLRVVICVNKSRSATPATNLPISPSSQKRLNDFGVRVAVGSHYQGCPSKGAARIDLGSRSNQKRYDFRVLIGCRSKHENGPVHRVTGVDIGAALYGL